MIRYCLGLSASWLIYVNCHCWQIVLYARQNLVIEFVPLHAQQCAMTQSNTH